MIFFNEVSQGLMGLFQKALMFKNCSEHGRICLLTAFEFGPINHNKIELLLEHAPPELPTLVEISPMQVKQAEEKFWLVG